MTAAAKHASYSSGVDCRLQPWAADPARAVPLPPRTRAQIEIDGPRWAEIDPETGEILAEGTDDDTSDAEAAA